MHRSTGQASLEFALLTGLAAAARARVGVALRERRGRLDGRGAAAGAAAADPARDDTWAIGSPTWGPLIRRYAPRLVLERDVYRQDAERAGRLRPLPAAGVRALGVGRRGGVRPSGARAGAAYIHYWFYYPDSRTPTCPTRAWHAPRRLGGRDRAPRAPTAPRRARHGARRAGRRRPLVGGAPGWRPIGRRPVIYRASGSHANGFAPGDIDLAGDRWNGTLGEVARRSSPPTWPRSRRFRFDPAASPPWRKRLWRDPDAAGTGADGGQGREVDAARTWAATLGRAR